MTQNQPLVSIGMPIYNAEHLIRRALDTLVAQDYENFEIIICDNASTDGTWDILQEYQAKHSRIRLYRNPTNIGAAGNFERVFSLATGKYFAWAAYDDWWEPRFISQCVARLEAVPESPLCYVQHIEVDETANTAAAIPYAVDLEHESAWERAYNLLSAWPMPNVYVYGMFRREMLKQIMPMEKIIAADTLLLLKAAQLGKIVHVDEPLHKYLVGPKGRGLRVYIRSIAPDISRWEAITWDWRLFFRFAKLIQIDAPDFRARLRGIMAAGKLVHHYTGWPLSLKMILNYLYILMPEALAVRIRAWMKNHPNAQQSMMQLINRRRTVPNNQP